MANPWFPGNSASVLSPLIPAVGDDHSPAPPLPPDPPDPDPNNPLSLARFPPLNSPVQKTPKTYRAPLRSPSQRSVVAATISKPTAGTVVPALASTSVVCETSNFGSGSQDTVHLDLRNFKIIPPKFSSPIQTNRASKSLPKTPPPLAPIPSPVNINSQSKPCPQPKTSLAPSTASNPLAPPASLPPAPPSHPTIDKPQQNQSQSTHSAPKPPLVERIRKSQNKTLTRLAPVAHSETGRPRVLIPDRVFQKGAELHKDFIICYFNGRPPPFNHTQSVLNNLWGKGKRVEIHSNPLSRSMLVRIPSDYLRQKILEKRVWYVGDSMFQAIQWTSSASSISPPLDSIQIWAHLTGIPLDLRHEEGLSLVAGLVGEPKETDDFTLNLVSLTLSHVKVAVDLTQPLPEVVEFTRESGEVVEVSVSYPWVPPTCSHSSGKVPSSTQEGKKAVASDDTDPMVTSMSHLSTEASPIVAPPSSASVITHPIPPLQHSLHSSPTPSPPSPQPSQSIGPQKNPSSSFRPQILPSPASNPQINLPSPSNQLIPFSLPPSPASSPDSRPPLKRPRSSPSANNFSSFTAQLNFFTKPIPEPPISSSPVAFISSNPFTLLSPNGPLLLEEAID